MITSEPPPESKRPPVMQETPAQEERFPALGRDQSLFRTLVENASDGLNLLDLATGRYVFVNAATAAITGFSAEEIKNLAVEELQARVHPDDRSMSLDNVQRLANGEEPGPSCVQFRWRVKSGEYRWFSHRRSVVRDAAGRPLALVGVSRDITAQKEAEDQLRFHASLLDNAGDPVISTDGDFRIVTWNKAAEATYGYSREEAVGRTVMELLQTEFPGSDRDTVIERLHHEGVAHIRVVHHGKHGERLHVEPVVVTLPDSTGHARRIAILRNVTKRHLAEETMRRSRAKLDAALASMTDAVYFTDPEGHLLEFNDAFVSYHRFASREACPGSVIEYQRYLEALTPDGKPATVYNWAIPRALRGETATNVEFMLRRKDTGETWIGSYSFAPMRNRDGQVLGAVVVARDITDLKRAQEQSALAEREIAEQRGRAQAAVEADRRKDEFLAMLSHELRNPLAPICYSLRVVKRAEADREASRRALARIEHQVEHMTKLVDELLDVTRIKRGKVQLQRERLDLNDLAQSTIEDHRGEFIEHGIGLDVSTMAGDVWVDGDRTRLAQVIGNLLHNALKFTPRGGKTTVSITADPSRRRATVRVEDTGRGVAPDMLPHLFDAFVQADTTIDRSLGGLGLGLAIVKGLVEMHGGSVSAASEGAGRGAAFTIELPLEECAGAVAAVHPVSLHLCARRVLVIEDNVYAAAGLSEVLKTEGHTTEIAYRGSEAIAKARAFRPHVVLCDIGLPDMDGYAVAKAMRADPELAQLRLVALTEYAAPEDIAKARQAGFDNHLAKPPNIDDLERIIEQGTVAR